MPHGGSFARHFGRRYSQAIGALRLLLAQLKVELDQLTRRIEEADAVLKQTAQEDEACQRLVAIPASQRLRRPHSSPPLATERPSARLGSWPPGWEWCHEKIPPASRSC